MYIILCCDTEYDSCMYVVICHHGRMHGWCYIAYIMTSRSNLRTNLWHSIPDFFPGLPRDSESTSILCVMWDRLTWESSSKDSSDGGQAVSLSGYKAALVWCQHTHTLTCLSLLLLTYPHPCTHSATLYQAALSIFSLIPSMGLSTNSFLILFKCWIYLGTSFLTEVPLFKTKSICLCHLIDNIMCNNYMTFVWNIVFGVYHSQATKLHLVPYFVVTCISIMYMKFVTLWFDSCHFYFVSLLLFL